jgi:hypothetical protein
MRLYCCLNPSRRARERATRGRPGQALSSSPGGQREDAANQGWRPALHHWDRLACARSRPQVASQMEDGAVWINKHLDILPYAARVCRDGRSSGLGTSAKILCPQPRSSVRALNGNAISCLKPKTVLHICPSRIYRSGGVRRESNSPLAVPDSKFVPLTVNVDWTWRTHPLMPQGAGRSLASRRMLQKAGASGRGRSDEMRRTSESGH